MIFAKPGLKEDLFIEQKEEFRYVKFTKGQAYSQEANLSSPQRGCYVRTMTTRAQLQKKSPVLILKGLSAKTK
jgi:hypothetical protein